MNKKITALLIALAIGLTFGLTFLTNSTESISQPSFPDGEPESNYNAELTALSAEEAHARGATVKILTPSGGHGSGTLYNYQGNLVVFTAKHVVEGPGIYWLVDEWGEERSAIAIYLDEKYDFAILKISKKFTKTKPWRLRIPLYDIRDHIDKGLIFSGYPSSLPMLTNRGSVAGFKDNALIMHSAAWMGSSGSNVFDNSGNFIGILYAISVGSFYGTPTLMEDVVWVTPYYLLNWKVIKKTIKEKG